MCSVVLSVRPPLYVIVFFDLMMRDSRELAVLSHVDLTGLDLVYRTRRGLLLRGQFAALASL